MHSDAPYFLVTISLREFLKVGKIIPCAQRSFVGCVILPLPAFDISLRCQSLDPWYVPQVDSDTCDAASRLWRKAPPVKMPNR